MSGETGKPDPCFTIACMDAKQACENEPDIEMRLRKAMRATKGHYLLAGEVSRLQAACAGAMLSSSPEERERIASSCRALISFNNALFAASRGVPVDFGEVVEQMPAEPLPIRRLWEDV